MSIYRPTDDEYSDAYCEYQEEQIRERLKTYPVYHFVEYMANMGLFYTPDNLHFFMLQESFNYEKIVRERICTACVKFSTTPNTYIPYSEWKKYVVHIDWLTANSELRGTGTLSVLSKFIQEAAEETGVVVLAHARPFSIELPTMVNHKEVEYWLENHTSSVMSHSLKKEKKLAKGLYKKYLEYGFCNYDGTGMGYSNRFWKETSFGYRSSKLKDSEVSRFIDKHLHC